MLSRHLKRACLDTQWTPPLFLLPWAANLTTTSHTTDPSSIPDSLLSQQRQIYSSSEPLSPIPRSTIPEYSPPLAPAAPSSPALSDSIKELLPLLRLQGSHYITAHIHAKPYLLTQGDTLRLPFLMHGVEPGDVLRLNRATNLGSRDYTLKAAAAPPRLRSPAQSTKPLVDPATGTLRTESSAMSASSGEVAPHYIPHIAKGTMAYLDERLFVCRAVVMGVEAEPMRIKEKTKQRQRKVKTVHSKHKFTVLRIKEVRVRSVEEIEGGENTEGAEDLEGAEDFWLGGAIESRQDVEYGEEPERADEVGSAKVD